MSDKDKIIPKGAYDFFNEIGQGNNFANQWVEGYGFILPKNTIIKAQYKPNETFYLSIYARIGNARSSGKILTTPEKSRIILRGDTFIINLDKLHTITRNAIKRTNENGPWEAGQIGVSLDVAKIEIISKSLSNEIPRYDKRIPGPYPSLDPSYNRPRVSSQDPMGIKGPAQVGIGNNVGGIPKGGTGFLIAVNAYILAYTTISSYHMLDDIEGIQSDRVLLEKAFKLVEHASRKGNIPEKYQNSKDMAAITNFIYQGVNDTGDPVISEIGLYIVHTYYLKERK